ncbi:MAG: exodeoxyribonuclease VII small subunit [Snowella sp.]|nr:exodeoxyribonuclease VII small subunit [Snowella sp.]
MSRKTSKEWNYEESINHIEQIIDEIESGSLPLDTVFSQFAIAVEQLQRCEAFLNKGKEKMELLIETLEDDF